MKILNKINNITQNISTVILILMTGLVLFQVISRYVLKISVAQSEELARYAMIWMAMLGSANAIRSKTHISVEFLCDKFPLSIKKVVKIFSYLCILAFCGILLYYGSILTLRSMLQFSPSMPLKIGYITSVIPISGALGILYSLELIFNEVKTSSTLINKVGE